MSKGKELGSDDRNIRKAQKYGRLTTLGFVGRWSDTPDGEKIDRYLCRCTCGRKVQVRSTDLEDGSVYSCAACAPLGMEVRKPHSDADRRRGEYEDSKSMPSPVSNELTLKLLMYRKQLPKWWWACLGTMIDQMCQMCGRGTYTDAQICAYFECPQEVLDLIRARYDKQIKRIRSDYDRICKQFAYIEKIPSDMIPLGVFNHFFHVAITNTTKRYKGDMKDI